jgi:hypothetical protein
MNCKGAKAHSILKEIIIKSNTYIEFTDAAPILAINHLAHSPRLCASAVRFARLRGEALQ